MKEVEDHLTRRAAEHLAKRIQTYWSERGFDVYVWIESFTSSEGTYFRVRSDLVAGLPRGEERRCLETMLSKD
jgi:hypothetical protein